MHYFLPLKRLTPHALRRHHAESARQGSASQPDSAAFAGSVPPELYENSHRVGRCIESTPPRRGPSFSSLDARDSAPFPRRAAPRIGGQIHNVIRRGGLILIRSYQLFISPALPSSCRFYPSCSAYAYEAVEKWGLRRGAWLALRRLLRCHPLGKHGYDPVP